MEEKEALQITDKYLAKAEMSLQRARERNADETELTAIEKKIAYYSYIGDVLAVLKKWGNGQREV